MDYDKYTVELALKRNPEFKTLPNKLVYSVLQAKGFIRGQIERLYNDNFFKERLNIKKHREIIARENNRYLEALEVFKFQIKSGVDVNKLVDVPIYEGTKITLFTAFKMYKDALFEYSDKIKETEEALPIESGSNYA